MKTRPKPPFPVFRGSSADPPTPLPRQDCCQRLLNIAEVPKDCRECMFTYHCTSWYGGTTCQYRKELAHMTINQEPLRPEIRTASDTPGR